MRRDPETVSVSITFTVLLVVLNAIVLQKGYVSSHKWYALLWVTVPLLLIVAVSRKKR